MTQAPKTHRGQLAVTCIHLHDTLQPLCRPLDPPLELRPPLLPLAPAQAAPPHQPQRAQRGEAPGLQEARGGVCGAALHVWGGLGLEGDGGDARADGVVGGSAGEAEAAPRGRVEEGGGAAQQLGGEGSEGLFG